jgi:hypothetical protein
MSIRGESLKSTKNTYVCQKKFSCDRHRCPWSILKFSSDRHRCPWSIFSSSDRHSCPWSIFSSSDRHKCHWSMFSILVKANENADIKFRALLSTRFWNNHQRVRLKPKYLKTKYFKNLWEQ